ncbi:hypothetical protein GCM10027296_28390 [Chitinimonas naiadis]
MAVAAVADYVTLLCRSDSLTAHMQARLAEQDVWIETRVIVGILGAWPAPDGILLEDGEIPIVDMLLTVGATANLPLRRPSPD